MISDISVSNCHVKIHCIRFESELSSELSPPLIYVEDLSSRNGTYLIKYKCQEQPLRAKHGPYLIDSGDKLRLGLHTTCIFPFCGSRTPPIALNETQKLETKACSCIVYNLNSFFT